MTAELRKLSALPTPRWTFAATVFAVAVAMLVAARSPERATARSCCPSSSASG